MLNPRVKFFEINKGYAPIRTNVRNRIGIFAPFDRGPINDIRFIGGFTDFSDTYGSNNSIGSQAFQVAWDQGAREFGLIRVAGKGRAASGKVSFSGFSTKNNNIILTLKFIGPVVQQSDRNIKSNIMTSGVYTGVNSGRYWFRVTDIDEDNFVTIKYKFIPLGVNAYLEWDPVSNDLEPLTIDSQFTEDTKNKALSVVSQESGLSTNILELKGAQRVNWTNGCLELPQPGEACTQSIIDGWEIVIEAGQLRWTLHSDLSGNHIRVNDEKSGYKGTLPGIGASTIREVTNTGTGEDLTIDPNNITSDIGIIPVEDYVVFNLEEDGGAPIATSEGIFLTFDTANMTSDIALDIGDMWSVRTNAHTFQIPIYEDATPNQVITAMEDTLAGKDPLGSGVERDQTDTTATFSLMEELVGSAGNNYSYHFDLQEPDGEVVTETTFYSGEKYVQVPIRFAPFIQEGATVSIIDTPGIYGVRNISNPFNPNSPKPSLNKDILEPNTTVTRVEAPMTGGGLAVIWLDKPVRADFDSIGVFHFANPVGLSMTRYTHYQATFMQGGEDGPRRAERDFYSLNGTPLLKLLATSEGEWANSLRVTLNPIDNERVLLSIRDLNKDNYDPPIQEESFVIRFDETDDNGFITVLNSSKFVRGVFIPKFLNPNFNARLMRKSPMRLAPSDNKVTNPEDPAHPEMYGPDILKEVSLEDGYDGPPPTEQDYLDAIDIAKDHPLHFILAPGQYSDIVRQALISQANSATELEGLRVAILNARPGLTPHAARNETIGYESTRAVMVAGWATYRGIIGATRHGLSPDAILAGKLASIPFFVGPNARTTAGAIAGISEVDTRPYSSRSQLQRYTDAKLEIVHMDPALFTYHFMNGRTLSTNTQWDKVSYRRTFDVIRMDLAQNLQQYKSEPNTSDLRRRISSALDAYFSTRVRNGQISSYGNTSVTSPNPASNRIDIRVSIVPIYAADYIDVYLIRDDEGNVSSSGA